eukprot:1273781-Rhodomonas_salina.3
MRYSYSVTLVVCSMTVASGAAAFQPVGACTGRDSQKLCTNLLICPLTVETLPFITAHHLLFPCQ